MTALPGIRHGLVPSFIVERAGRHESAGRLQAASLCVDTTGFTHIAAQMMQHGREGAKALAGALQAVFRPMIEIVYRQGGFVAHFAGDGLVALFPDAGGADKTQARLAYQRAFAAAWGIRQQMMEQPSQATPFGAYPFQVRISLAGGQARWQIWQAPDRAQRAFAFFGEAIDRAIEASPFAGGGQIVAGPEAQAALGEAAVAALAGQGSASSAALAQRLGYRHLVAMRGNALPAPMPVATLPAANDDLAALFCSPELHEAGEGGEFRQILAAFVNLPTGVDDDPQLTPVPLCLRLLGDYGGHLGRIARAGAEAPGLTLLAFWGAPTSHEDDVERALSFLVDLQMASPVPVRAGVTWGTAYAGLVGSALRSEYTCYGHSVDLAARRMAAAPWGEIWLDEATARRAQERFTTCWVGRQPFKGVAEPQPVWTLSGRPAPRHSPFFRGDQIGRERELAQLAAFLSPIFAGPGRYAGVTALYGAPGMGKSRLLYELGRRYAAASRPPLWLQGRSQQVVRRSLNPFRAMLNAYFEQTGDVPQRRAAFERKLDELIARTPDATLREELGRNRATLAALIDLPGTSPALDELAAPLRFERMLYAFRALVRAECQSRPVVVALDDAQWLDPDSLHMLQVLARHMEPNPLAIIVASRYHGDGSTLDLSLDDGVPRHVLHLENLLAEEVALLAIEVLGRTVDAELATLLAEKTGGNPFFAEQMLLDLQERNALRRRDGCYVLRAASIVELPSGIHAVLVARLERLAPGVQAVVQAASVLGREFQVPVLARMLDGDRNLPAKIQKAAEARVWSLLDDTRCLFQHVLWRESAYGMQLRTRVRLLHRQAAEAIAALYAADPAPHYTELAHHYGQAGDVERERRYARLAGERAAASYANAEAVRHLSRALELTPQDDLAGRLAILLRREQVHGLQGDRVAQRADLNALAALAPALADARSRAELTLRQAAYADASGDYAAAIAAIREAASMGEATQDLGLQARAHEQWAKALNHLADYPAACEHLEQAIALARAASLPQVEALCLDARGVIIGYQGHPDEATRSLEQALAILRRIGDRNGQCRTLGHLSAGFEAQGDLARAQAYAEQALAVSSEIGDPGAQALARIRLGDALLSLQRPDEAATAYRAALGLLHALDRPMGRLESLAGLARVALTQGDLAGAQARVDEILTPAVDIAHDALEPMAVYLACYHVLSACGSPHARELLGTAYRQLQERAAKIGDEAQRALFLEQVPAHRELVAAWGEG